MSNNGKPNGDGTSLIQQAAQAWYKREAENIEKEGVAIPKLGLDISMTDSHSQFLFKMLFALGTCARAANDEIAYAAIGTICQYVAYNRARTDLMGPIFKLVEPPLQPPPELKILDKPDESPAP
jgi:hypothetical protein